MKALVEGGVKTESKNSANQMKVAVPKRLVASGYRDNQDKIS